MPERPELARVRRAFKRRAAAQEEARAAARAAREAGHSFARIGKAAGISGPGVRKITVGRPPTA